MFKNDKPTTRLRELRGSDFEIVKGQPDIRGWDVRDKSGRKFGVVHDLVFDLRAQKVRYMIINVLDTKELELEKRTVMVPIGMAELDGRDNDVILPDVTPFQLRALPRYDKHNLGAKAERDISTVFGRTALGDNNNTSTDVDEKFYDHDHFNENNMYRNRRRKQEDPYLAEKRAEEASLRREAELGTPVSTPELEEELRRRKQNANDEYNRHETDEEYFRRTGHHRRR